MPSRKSRKGSCSHDQLHLESSPHAAEVGYKQLSPSQLFAAKLPSGRILKATEADQNSLNGLPALGTFPAPLILPGDDLADDPNYPAQSLRSFVRSKHRNEITRERGTIYVVPPPDVANEVEIVKSWIQPSEIAPEHLASFPQAEDVISFLSAFYYPIPVKLYNKPLTFTTWSDESTFESKVRSKSRSKSNATADFPQYIGLATTTSCTRIRCRPCPAEPDSDAGPLFPTQLSLSDLLDALIGLLPSSAYAILLLTHHDIYESPEDDFCCGRAYGGSRVAVVSSARYQSCLDIVQGIDTSHAWPASHCAQHVAELCGTKYINNKKKKTKETGVPSSEPMSCALRAFVSPVSPLHEFRAPKTNSIEWSKYSTSYIRHLYRVSRTAAHELGHCLCLGHCVYYACLMQGTAGLNEDARQPPVMCAVCESKIGWAVDAAREKGVAVDVDPDPIPGGNRDKGGWRREREKRLVEVGEGWAGLAATVAVAVKRDKKGAVDGDGDGAEGWRAMAAWLRARWEVEREVEHRFEEREGANQFAVAGAGTAGIERRPKRRRTGMERGKGGSGGELEVGMGLEVIDLTT